MRNYALLVWIGFIVVAIAIASVPSRAPLPITRITTNEPLNYLLLPGPLVPKEFGKKYISTSEGVAAGQPLTVENLTSQPVMPSIPLGKFLASAPTEWAEIQAGLNATAAVKICKDSAELASATVVAVKCDFKQVPPTLCEAIFTFPASADGLLKEFATQSNIKAAVKC